LVFLGYYINDSMGLFGLLVKKVLTGLMGIPSIIVPVLLIVFPVLLIFKKDKDAVIRKSLYSFILIALIAAIFQAGIYQETDFVNRSPISCIVKFFEDGNRFTGGGVLGGIIALPLLLLFQPLGTIIILSTASIVTIILITNISLYGIVKKLFISFATQMKAIGHGIKEVKENSTLRNEETEYEEKVNIYKPGKGRKKGNVYEGQDAEEAEDVGFTFNFSGMGLNNEEDSQNEKKVIDMKRHRKFKHFTIGEGKNGDNGDNEKNEDNVSDNIKHLDKLSESDLLDENRKHKAEYIIFPFNMHESEKVLETSNGFQEKNENKMKMIENEVKTASNTQGPGQIIKETFYKYPPLSLLNEIRSNDKNLKSYRNAAIEGARKLEETLKSFGVEAKVVNVSMGPAVTRFELQPSVNSYAI
jgi:S-DNA-T family DNA segregation ATPase FtsK/SpoIIIE